MGTFLSYSLVSGLLIFAMYLAYRISLSNEKQYSFNRGVLLAIYLVSFIIAPFILFYKTRYSPSVSIPGILKSTESGFSDSASHISSNWSTIAIWIFLVGMLLVTIKTVITWGRIINVIRSGERIIQNGYTLVITNNEKYAPFSWMRYMVISRRDYSCNVEAIEIHELKHISSHHWVDLLIAQCICIINWFNPAAWLMRKELLLIHEYQADTAVIKSGYDLQSYQLLLIRKAVSPNFRFLANGLNHSTIKKRISMMYKGQSSDWKKLKLITLLPMLAVAIGITIVPNVQAALSTIRDSNISIDKKKGHSVRPASKYNSFNSNKVNVLTPTLGDVKIIGVTTIPYVKEFSNREINPNSLSNDVSDKRRIYLDGKEISEEEMNGISPTIVSNVIVNRLKNTTEIFTKSYLGDSDGTIDPDL